MEREPVQIKFGTDGWRAVISDEFTFENVRLVAQAIAQYLKSPGREALPVYHLDSDNPSYQVPFRPFTAGVVVGYDTRFLSEGYAEEVARVLSSNEIPVFQCSQALPTPTVSFAIKDRQAAGGVMITASHNPYQWNGMKVKMEYAGSSPPEVTQEVEQQVKQILSSSSPIKREPRSSIERLEPLTSYMESLRKLVEVDRLKSSGYVVAVDPMYGAGQGLFRKAVPGLPLVEIHGERNPCFGGRHPEPLDETLPELKELVRGGKAQVGFAFDGDADRIAAVDEKGRYLDSHDIFCLLLWHLVRFRGWKGGVAKTFSTTKRVKLLTEHFGLPFYETPVGFKHICHLMLTRDILIGGEESGGIGIKNHIPERDSLLNALLLLELMVSAGKKLGEILAEIHREIGEYVCHRLDLRISSNEAKQNALRLLRESPPASFDGTRVAEVSHLDGVKYLLEDGSWILFRASGTEPLIRVYAEAQSSQKAGSMLSSGEAMVKEGAGVGG